MQLASPPSKLLVSLFALALTLLLVALFLIERGQPGSALTTSDTAREALGQPGAQLEDLAHAGSEEEQRTAIEAEDEAAVTQLETTDAPSKLRLAGTAELINRSGLQRRDIHGDMYLSFRYGHGERHVSVPVVNGLWEVEFDLLPSGNYVEAGSETPEDETHFVPELRNSLVTASSLRMHDGLLIEASRDGPRFALGEEEALVQFALIVPVLLSVVDARSGAQLNHVTILEQRPQQSGGPIHPQTGNRYVVVEDSPSPIELDPSAARDSNHRIACLVGSPGFSWTEMEIDFEGHPQQRIALEPGGDLEVEITGHTTKQPRYLCLYADDPRVALVNQDITGMSSLTLTGLLARNYKLQVRLRTYIAQERQPVVARGEVEVFAGERSRITLDLTPHADQFEGQVSGRIVLPSGWQLSQFNVFISPVSGTAKSRQISEQPEPHSGSSFGSRGEFEGWRRDPGRPTPGESPQATLAKEPSRFDILLDQDDFERDPIVADTFHFDLGLITTGTYALTVKELDYTFHFDVGPEGCSDLHFAVPEPVSITVQVLEKESRDPAFLDGFTWYSQSSTLGQSGVHTLKVSPAAFEFQLQVPRGEVVLTSLTNDRFGTVRLVAKAEEGTNLLLEVEPSCGVLIELRAEGTHLPWPDHARVQASQIDGRGHAIESRKTQNGLRLTVSEPGRYQVIPPELLGYSPGVPQQVDIRPGEFKTVVVELKRYGR